MLMLTCRAEATKLSISRKLLGTLCLLVIPISEIFTFRQRSKQINQIFPGAKTSKRKDVFPFQRYQQYVDIFRHIFLNQRLAFSSHGFVSLLDCLHYSMRWPQYSALQLDYQTRARADSLTSDKSGKAVSSLTSR